MTTRIAFLWQMLCTEIWTHKTVYILLAFIFLFGLFVRIYRSYDLLGFYFDQGRDALAVQKILHGHFTLIGPTTGFAGIFRGPFYYYYLAPAYFIARGNPGVVGGIAAAINSLGLLVIFSCGAAFFNRTTGLLAAFCTAISFYAVSDSRWLSNPAPLWLFAPLVFLCIVLGVSRNWKWLPLGTFLLGLTLQMEEAGMGFVCLAIGLFCLVHIRQLRWWQWGMAAVTFLVTFAPLGAFDVRHQFLITHNILKLLFGSGKTKSFALPLTITKTLAYFSGEIGKELFITQGLVPKTWPAALVIVILFGGFIAAIIKTVREKLSIQSNALQLALLWMVVPICCVMFYKNSLFAYYFIGLYAIFFLIIGRSLAVFFQNKFTAVFGIFVLVYLLSANEPLLISHLRSHVEQNSTTIVLENQTQAIRYVYASMHGQPSAIAVYVPPQMPYTYDYLFPWIRNREFPTLRAWPLSQATFLYTLHEIDPDHPLLAQRWLASWDKTGTIIEAKRFGGIQVEKRIVMKTS